MAVSKRKPQRRVTTIKTLADHANRTLKPEREEHVYEFGNGTKSKKAGKGIYGYDSETVFTQPLGPDEPTDPPF